MRPRALVQIGRVLQSLALSGAVPVGVAGGEWLRSVAAVYPDSTGRWLCADPEWFRSVVRSHDPVVMVRGTAIRDPLYRFHVDTMVVEVLQSIGRSGRWQRLEELLFGPVLSFASRFVQLLESSGDGTSAADEHQWSSIRASKEGENSLIFKEWDRELWTDVQGGAAALFPVLLELYVPLCSEMVSVHHELHGLSNSVAKVLTAIIQCAQRGECLLLDPNLTEELNLMRSLGLPVRRWAADSSSPDQRLRVGLAMPVRLLSDSQPQGQSEGIAIVPVGRGCTRQSFVETVQQAALQAHREDFWSHAVSANQCLAFPGLGLGDVWPVEPEPAPRGARVPAAMKLRGLGLSRKRSPDVDEALRMLSDHLIFGLLVQLLLLEALDRELGQETINLSIKKVESDGKSQTQVKFFYKPAEIRRDGQVHRDPPVYSLGDFESVMRQLSLQLSVQAMQPSSELAAPQLWTAALLMLEQVGILFVDASHDRCFLSVEALDRLHGGELMTKVIRNGQSSRESMRSALREMWRSIDMSQDAGAMSDGR